MADEMLPQTLAETEDELEDEYEEDPRIALMSEMLADQKKTNAEIVRAMTQRPAQAPLQQDRVAPDLMFSLDGLPDPAYDVSAFHKEYAKRATEVVGRALNQTEQRAIARASQMVADKDTLSKADETVLEALPWTTKEMRGYAAGVITARLRAEGREPMTELRNRFDDVTQEIVDHLADTFPQAAPRAAAPRRDTGGRAKGLVSARGRTPGRPVATPKGENPREFFNDLTGVQSKARLY